ncbi:unnamed protein product [Urochloa humidicola]
MVHTAMKAGELEDMRTSTAAGSGMRAAGGHAVTVVKELFFLLLMRFAAQIEARGGGGEPSPALICATKEATWR